MSTQLEKPARRPALQPNIRVALNELALREFELNCGGRHDLIRILSYQIESTECDRLLELLADPANASLSLGRLCAEAGLTIGKFLKFFSTAKSTQAILAAMDQVYPLIPEIVGDLIRSAKITYDRCPSCFGSCVISGDARKSDNQTKRCGLCKGKGMVEVMPALDRQKTVLQLIGLLKNNPQVVVDQSNKTQINMPVSMKSFISATNRILYGPSTEPKVIEGTVVSAAEEPSETPSEPGNE